MMWKNQLEQAMDLLLSTKIMQNELLPKLNTDVPITVDYANTDLVSYGGAQTYFELENPVQPESSQEKEASTGAAEVRQTRFWYPSSLTEDNTDEVNGMILKTIWLGVSDVLVAPVYKEATGRDPIKKVAAVIGHELVHVIQFLDDRDGLSQQLLEERPIIKAAKDAGASGEELNELQRNRESEKPAYEVESRIEQEIQGNKDK